MEFESKDIEYDKIYENIFKVKNSDEWYFYDEGYNNYGPYNDRTLALEALSMYIAYLNMEKDENNV